MGNHEGGVYWHGLYPPPTQHSTSFGCQNGYGPDSHAYHYWGSAPSGLVDHPSLHPAVGSSQW